MRKSLKAAITAAASRLATSVIPQVRLRKLNPPRRLGKLNLVFSTPNRLSVQHLLETEFLYEFSKFKHLKR